MEKVYGQHIKATAKCIQSVHAVNTAMQHEILEVKKRALNNSCVNRILVESVGNLERRLGGEAMNAAVLEGLVRCLKNSFVLCGKTINDTVKGQRYCGTRSRYTKAGTSDRKSKEVGIRYGRTGK